MKGFAILSVIVLLCLPHSLQAFDYSGTGKDSLGIFRPSSGLWALQGITRRYFGALGDTVVPGDYNGDGTASLGIFRTPKGLWAILGTTRVYFGRTSDVNVGGDYNGDGISDIAVFRGTSGLWGVRGVSRVYFGSSEDTSLPADYNGDGKFDIAVFRRASGLWAVRGITRIYFGSFTHSPVPADFNGNGRADPAVFVKSNGLWAVRGMTRAYFGSSGDIPLPADYDGDSTADIGLFRPSTGLWAVKGITRAYYGNSEDIPVSSRINWQLPVLPTMGIEVMRRYLGTSQLSKLSQTGCTLTQFGYLSWNTVEPVNTGPENYDWSSFDDKLSLFSQYGQTVLLGVADIPSWAGEFNDGPIDLSALPDFAEFLQAAVSRYKNPPYNIKFWVLFNEPDGTKHINGPGIGCWGEHGDRYAEMLKYAYPAIKAADPEAQVILGGLAYDNFIGESETGQFNRDFIADVLKNGGGDYFDVMNFHYYYFSRETWENIIGKATQLKNVLAYWGVTKPMICSEVGIWGDEDDYHLELQARYVPVVYARGLSAELCSIIWFPLSTLEGDTFEGGLLREEDLSEKPAYKAYQVMNSQLNGYKYTGYAGQNGIEGYSFRPAAGGRTRQVLWTDIENASAVAAISITAGHLTVTDKLGVEKTVWDGGSGDYDGSNNGSVRIYVGSSPVYVEVFP
jgi:Beta-galactosidase